MSRFNNAVQSCPSEEMKTLLAAAARAALTAGAIIRELYDKPHTIKTVSYTHLTLPTKRIV